MRNIVSVVAAYLFPRVLGVQEDGAHYSRIGVRKEHQSIHGLQLWKKLSLYSVTMEALKEKNNGTSGLQCFITLFIRVF